MAYAKEQLVLGACLRPFCSEISGRKPAIVTPKSPLKIIKEYISFRHIELYEMTD